MGLSVFLILFVLMGSVSAINDNITDLSQDTDNAIAQEKISTGNDDSSLKEIENNEILKTNPKNTTLKTLVGGNTFADIQTAIDSAASGDTLELNGLYKGSGTPVIIDKNNLTIVGNDAILDAQGQSRIFNITGTGIILKNIGFINGNATDKGGAIYWYGVNGAINDCNFANNKAAQMGGAIYWYGANGSINNSNFISNTAEKYSGGAIQWNTNSANGTVNGCNFTNNIGTQRGGAVYCQGKNGTINNSIFINNTSINGGAINWAPDALNGAVNNSTFINNTGNDGGTTYWEGKNGRMSNCDFINNIGTNGGAINWQKAYGLVSDCNFINNKATGNGGAVYWEGSNGTENNCNFTNNTAQSNGGAIYWYAYNGTISNTNFVNNTAESNGGAIYAAESLTLNNIIFIDNYAVKQGGAVGLYGNVTLNCKDSHFIDNYAEAGSSIFVEKGKLNIYNTDLSSKVFNKYSQIVAFKNSIIYVENVTFIDSASSYATALYFKSIKSATIRNSKFINLKANLTAGAIGLRNGGELYIENCEFTNTTSTNNGGAVFADITGENEDDGNVTLIDSMFRDTYSGFGGAYVQLGGRLLLSNSEFINSHATFNGGAVYLSYTDAEISNCNFTSNGVELNDQDYPTYGGAALFDMSTISINNVNFINNTASAGSAIYAYDTAYDIKNSLFENNKNPIYTVFDVESNIDKSNTFINDDNISTNNTYFATIISTPGIQLTLLNNSINVTALPKRFDLREWGWVSPVKNQGWIGACWTFGMTSALESSLLKATGILSDLSENSMRNLMLRYSVWGSKDLYEGAYNAAAAAYLISWLGAFIEDADQFDEIGKISPYISTLQDVHVQDVMFIPNNEIPNGTQMKEAIIKYGALDVGYFGQSTFDQANPYFNPETNAQYVNVSIPSNHEVSVVGWDDNYPKENFLITPPGDGAWIIKNSWGTGWGDNGYLYVSYYDKTFVESTTLTLYATAIIFENTVQYNKNYQYDIAWAGAFLQGEGNRSYLNQYVAQDDDLIAGVGTYFNQADVNYTVEIYVNDELKLTQEGISPFCGYHTIKLDSYIPIKKGDVFKAKISSNTVPYITVGDERVHYTENISFIAMDGVTWEDAYLAGVLACLKVYTVADDSKLINNENVTVDYGSKSYFSVNVVTADGHSVGAGAAVNFTINGKTTTAITDADGIAKVEITDVPGTYDVTTTYNGETYKNKVNVKLNTKTCKITGNKNIKVDYGGGKYFSVKIVSQDGKVAASGVSVKFTINGKTKTVKTDKNGIAKIKITDVPKKYTMTTTYNGKSVKNTVIVKQVLKAIKVTVKKTAKKFTLKATLKINGKLVKGKVITFKFNGKTYKVKTNKKGIAQKTLDKKVIKKLKKGKTYTVKVTYLKDTIKTTVKVK